MTYEYTLNKKAIKKYNFTSLLCDGWMGIYADNFNKKYDDRKQCYININLNDDDIDYIVKNSINYKEY